MISKRTKYGLKALSYIARKENNQPVQTHEIATEENISLKFLEAILTDLKKKGFLAAKKGKGGGYYLLKPANEITIASVLRHLEGPIAWLPCVSLNYYEKCDDCTSEENCRLNPLFVEVRDNILAIVENKTIADL